MLRHIGAICAVVLLAVVVTPRAVAGASNSPDEDGARASVHSGSPGGQPSFHPQRLLVKPRKGRGPSTLSALHTSNGSRVLHTFPKIGDLQVVQLPDGADVMDFVGRYQKSGLIEYAEPDYLISPCETHPDDYYYAGGWLWGLNNTGQHGEKPDADIDAPEGWDTIHDAPNVVVAVIDSGVRYTHEDLADNMWVNQAEDLNANGRFDNWPSTEQRDGVFGDRDGLDNDGNGFVDDGMGWDFCTYNQSRDNDPEDEHGHGTFVAGVVGAVGNNAKGVVGVAWRTRIMALKFFGPEEVGYVSDAIACIDYARANGAHIMNNSWGVISGEPTGLYDAIASARSAGIVFVAGAGNDSKDLDSSPFYPACYDLDNIVSVAATDKNDQLAGFSDYGAQSVDLGAPGVDIVSTYNEDSMPYAVWEGTSFATPYVSGACALLKEHFPNESYLVLIRRLLAGADPLPALEGKCRTGGRLNLQKALTGELSDFTVMPLGGFLFAGMPGGPFGPATGTLVLTNYGTSALNWTVSNTESWLDLSPSTSGTLDAGESTNITLSVDSVANGLPQGTYTDTLTVTNTTNGSGSTTRVVTLHAGPVYVSPGGSDLNRGFSWQDTKRTIQAGLVAARPGQDVWVAAGTYVENITLAPGVGLYGGFAGTESSREQRNWRNNITIVDGNREGSVVYASEGLTSTTVIDGFTIQNGTGDPSTPGGVLRGGGIYCYNSSPTIRNNRVVNNTAHRGAGVYSEYNSSPLIAENEISHNSVLTNPWPWLSDGAGVCHYGGWAAPTLVGNLIAYNSCPGDGGGIASDKAGVITGNTLIGNSAGGFGGGIYLTQSGTATIAGNLIIGNTAGTKGGALRCEWVNLSIVGNTIVNNSATEEGGGISFFDASLALANNIVAFCSSGISSTRYWQASLANNCVYGNTAYDYFGVPPGEGDISLDPLFADRPNGDYHLTDLSPCINTGWNEAPGLPPTDMDGAPRIQFGLVDIGAYEYCCLVPLTTISDAKSARRGAWADVRGAIISAAFTDFFYVEADDRSSGLRVEKAGHGLQPGMRADVTGVVLTNSSGERYIFGVTAIANGTGDVKPLALNNRALGGGDWRYDPATGAGQRGVTGAVGLNNIGLLVKTCGRVTVASSSGMWFIIVDGSVPEGSSRLPPKVLTPPGVSLPLVQSFVTVTGVSSCEPSGPDLRSVILPRSAGDITYDVTSGNGPIRDGSLKLWLAADFITDVPSGGSVSAWADAAGTGLTVEQTNASLQPTYVPNAQNGRPVVRFDGAGYFVKDGVLGYSLTSEDSATVFLVLRQLGADPYCTSLGWGSTWNRFLTHTTWGDVLMLQHGDPGSANPGAIGVLQPLGWDDTFHVVEFRRNGSAGFIEVDWEQLASGTMGDTPEIGEAHPLYVGNDMFGNTFSGDIAEILVYSRSVADGEAAQVMAYLKEKYGL